MPRPTIEGSYILVIDDNEEMSQTLSRLLKQHNFVTREATDGDIALSCILERAPAAMILDFRMERVDGIGLSVGMRELGIRVPVIMLTAYPVIAEAVRAIQLGAADYLSKPFDHSELLRLLARLVSNPPANEVSARHHEELAP